MTNKWNERDILHLTRDCELGKQGDQLHVVSTEGPYMTVRHSDSRLSHTGRDYAFATKIGEGAVNDAIDFPLLVWSNYALTGCEYRLREVVRRMGKVSTTRRWAIRVAEICDRLEEIAKEVASEP